MSTCVTRKHVQGCEDAPPRNGRSQARERASPNDKAGSPIVAGAAARAGRQARMAAPRSPVMARQRSPQQSAAFASRSPRFASPAGSFGDASPSGRPAPVAFSWCVFAQTRRPLPRRADCGGAHLAGGDLESVPRLQAE